jgi:hypothetical protein
MKKEKEDVLEVTRSTLTITRDEGEVIHDTVLDKMTLSSEVSSLQLSSPRELYQYCRDSCQVIS